MNDEENLKLIEQVHKLLDQSDYDYVLLATRRLDNENIDGSIGLRTGDGFESAAHLLLEQAMSEKGSGFYTIKVRLATEFTKLDHVYIIDNRFKAEQDSLIAWTKKEEEQL